MNPPLSPNYVWNSVIAGFFSKIILVLDNLRSLKFYYILSNKETKLDIPWTEYNHSRETELLKMMNVFQFKLWSDTSVQMLGNGKIHINYKFLHLYEFLPIINAYVFRYSNRVDLNWIIKNIVKAISNLTQRQNNPINTAQDKHIYI